MSLEGNCIAGKTVNNIPLYKIGDYYISSPLIRESSDPPANNDYHQAAINDCISRGLHAATLEELRNIRTYCGTEGAPSCDTWYWASESTEVPGYPGYYYCLDFSYNREYDYNLPIHNSPYLCVE